MTSSISEAEKFLDHFLCLMIKGEKIIEKQR
jgi:hypothetical protein